MIDTYSAIMIARAEHEQMSRSLAPVSDDGSPMQTGQKEWQLKHLIGLLGVLRNGLSSLSERRKYGRDAALEGLLTRQESGGQ